MRLDRIYESDKNALLYLHSLFGHPLVTVYIIASKPNLVVATVLVRRDK